MSKLSFSRYVKEHHKNYIFVTIFFIAFLMTFFFGQMNNANDGSFGNGLNYAQLICFYVATLFSYAYLFYISVKNGILKINTKTSVAITILVVTFLYLSLVSVFTDYDSLNIIHEGTLISTINKVSSVMDSSLMCLFVFTIFTCLPNLKEKDLVMRYFCFGLLGFALSAIIYSLIKEFHVYETMITSMGFITKNSEYAYSFFTYGNVYGHLLYFGFLALLYLGYSFKKRWIYLLSIPFGFLIIYSGCRAGFICYLFTLLLLTSYFIYWLWNKKSIFGYIALTLVILLFTWFLLEVFVIRAIQIPYKVLDENEEYITVYHDLYYALDTLISDYLRVRNNLAMDLISKMNIYHIIFGLGIDNLDFLVRMNTGDFNFHNGIYTIYFTGGIFFTIIYLFIFIYTFINLFKILKFDKRFFILYLVFLFPAGLYQFSESYPAMFPVFGGGVMAMMLIASVHLKKIENNDNIVISQFI